MAQHISYPTVKVDGLSIFYREAGLKDAPTILLLHGLPSSSRMFEPLLTRLAGQFHMVAPDYPGFGHSDAPTPKEFSYTFDNVAKVMDHFTESLNLTKYTLLHAGLWRASWLSYGARSPGSRRSPHCSRCRRPQRRSRRELEDQARVLGRPPCARSGFAKKPAITGNHAYTTRRQ